MIELANPEAYSVLGSAASDAKTLDEACLSVLNALRVLKYELGITEIGYVSGIITSDGMAYKEANLELLREYTNALRGKFDMLLFSCPDIFSGKQEATFDIDMQPNLYKFWRSIIQSGYITDIYMTPRWKDSRGARDEHDAAVVSNIRIHYLDEDQDLLKICESMLSSRS